MRAQAGTVGINSDSAEEDAWSPRAPTPKEATSKPAAGSKASNSPTYATVDPESTAAVNLLAMSHKPKPHSSSSSHPAAPAPGRSHPAAVTSAQVSCWLPCARSTAHGSSTRGH